MYIPDRFTISIDSHMLGNLLGFPRYPLLLAVVGKPGMGKTYQLREYLKQTGVKIISISADEFENENAGRPAKLIKQKYVEASAIISTKKSAVLVIDDIDTTLGEWENNTGTVNHQDILSLLMHLADSPTYIEDVGEVNRVPIFFTGNYIEKMYVPLMREGRANILKWEPTIDEKVQILQEAFCLAEKETVKKLVNAYPDKSIAFFTSLFTNEAMNNFVSAYGNTADFNRIINDCKYKSDLIEKYNQCYRAMKWNEIADSEVERLKNEET